MKYLLPFFLLVCFATNATAQGCSDAGVCTLNAFKPSHGETASNHLKIGYTNGLADYDIAVNGAYLEYGRRFGEKFGADAKLAALGQSGNGIKVFGLSDIYLNANYTHSETTGFTVGFKIPLNAADRCQDEISLPMDYQSSLGTLDLILGVSHRIGKLQAVMAYQQPLTQNNNSFVPEAFPATSKLREIPSTFEFERAGDVLLRLSYPIAFGEKLRITPSLLPIYHVSNDKYTVVNAQKEIEGSKGFTLNGNVFVDYQLGEKGNLQLSLASPFVVRDLRPDGLTRGNVVGIEYGVRF